MFVVNELSSCHRVLKAYFVLCDKVHEFRGWMDNHAIGKLARTVIAIRLTPRVQITCTRVRPFGVNASGTETILHSEGVIVHCSNIPGFKPWMPIVCHRR